MRYKAQMVTTANDPEKTVSDDHRRDTAKRGEGHRIDGQEEEIQQADKEEEGDEQASPEGRIQPTRSCSSCQV